MMDISQNSFITNQEKFLSEIIKGILPKCSSVNMLVGYFYYSGFDLICENLKNKAVRILVGLEVDLQVSNKIKEVDKFIKSNQSRYSLKDDYYNSFVRLFNDTDFFDSADKIDSFKLFYSKILDGTLEIRKTETPCHAKMYLFEYNETVNEQGETPGTVITGSSNLSQSGLANRLEINARFSDKNSYLDGQKIFNALWDSSVVIADKNNLDDFNSKVIEHIWYEKLYSPYLMYIRVLNEYFSIPTKTNVLTPHDITKGKFLNLKYQTDAIQMALNTIENHNGVIVADVVGLGKSIIASTVARNMQLKTIVISPPHLKPQWEEYKDEFGFTATIFSRGQIESALNHYRKIMAKDEQFLIIIDEAHKYRNEYTKDYANLHNLCLGNKVILLTATPFNNRPEDIYSMLKLFQIPTKSTLKTVDNLGAAFKALITTYAQLAQDQRGNKKSEDEVKREANNIAKTIRSIISPLVVRRSRLDLQEIPEYRNDLIQQKIKPLIPNAPILLEYNLGSLQELYLKTLERISPSDKNSNAHHFISARYQPMSYILSDKRKELEDKLKEKHEIELNLLLGRQKNLSDFMRRLLVRRFESSVAAFHQSLNYMISSSEHIINWVETRNKVPIYKKGYLPSVEDFYETTDDNLQVEIEEKFEKYTQKGFFEIDTKYLRKADFLADVKADLALLKEIHTEWFSHEDTIQFDPKMESFSKILKKMEIEDPERKIIIFTEFADTANYLGDQLKNENLKVFKYTSADASTNNKEAIRANFDAGYKEEMQRDDYHILIATDAISEGYNLHRAGAVFNYDIPYNPTRVIQRIGRINRINKKMFSELYIYNYFPTDVGETETRTKEISTLKMAMIHAIMGEDTKALTNEEELQSFFKARYNQELRNSEESSWDTAYRKLLNQLKGTEEYCAALKITHRAKSARKCHKSREGVLLFGKKGNDFVFKLGNSTTSEPVLLTAEQAISLFVATPEEKAFETSKQFDSIYQKAKAHLFRNTTTDQNERERLNAMDKIKFIATLQCIKEDYIKDLMTVIEADGLSGFELRYINQLTLKNYSKLPNEIDQNYLNRVINTTNSIDEGDEILILAEELLQ